MLDQKTREALFVDAHSNIRSAVDGVAAVLRGAKPRLAYPPGISLTDGEIRALAKLNLAPEAVDGLRKVVADACAGPLFNLFCVVDAVGDPAGWEGPEWLGVDLCPRHDDEDRPMLHDEFFEAFARSKPGR